MIEPDFISRFTTHLKEALQKALSFAVQSGRDLVEPGDLLVGLLQEKGSIGSELLVKAEIKTEDAERAFRGSPSAPSNNGTITPDLSGTVKRILERCILFAHIHEQKYVGTEHLVAALLAIESEEIKRFFDESKVNVQTLKDRVASVLTSSSKFPDLSLSQLPLDEDVGLTPLPLHHPPQSNVRQKTTHSALEAFSRDLTHPDAIQQLDPVIGRDEETDRVIEILCRRTKNNPVLLGEPGVGKTAIVEGLAQRLASGDVPDALHGKRIVAVDLALTVAGTMYRGEFEARLKQLVEEATEDDDVILFIDEMHTIVGAGSTSGSLDAANILKPALARGDIRCIGATTWAEFKKHIVSDAALERRFQPVTIEEPSAEETRTMLEGLRGAYEKHHGVAYDAIALDQAVFLAERYLTDRNFPDKAIDLMDESAASVTTRRKNRDIMERMRSLEIACGEAISAKERAVVEQKLDVAEQHHAVEERLRKEYDAMCQTIEDERTSAPLIVTARDVAGVVARIAHLPVETILATERERMQDLDVRLKKIIVGQDAAISAVSDAVRKARLGLNDERRPRISMLFAGPSGTGKTELARTLAKELFGREDALMKLDMSEFAEGYGTSKLLGSPAGYVGYRESNSFTDAIRKRPHSVVCFDEVEKAHPDVLNLLLQILEDGQVTDATGRPVSFRHAYIILTSNLGGDAAKRTSLGFGGDAAVATDSFIRSDIEDRFRPELLNRLDKVIIFRQLEAEHMQSIVKHELDLALERVSRAQHVACHAGDDVLAWLLSQPMPANEGARAARRLIDKEITALLSKLLSEKPQKKTIKLTATKNGLKVI
ncbi:MAG: ATP-dependent Clp protease ATP-binding subunit [Patescibacteria group bacterium]